MQMNQHYFHLKDFDENIIFISAKNLDEAQLKFRSYLNKRYEDAKKHDDEEIKRSDNIKGAAQWLSEKIDIKKEFGSNVTVETLTEHLKKMVE